jgi:hypothetical protein
MLQTLQTNIVYFVLALILIKVFIFFVSDLYRFSGLQHFLFFSWKNIGESNKDRFYVKVANNTLSTSLFIITLTYFFSVHLLENKSQNSTIFLASKVTSNPSSPQEFQPEIVNYISQNETETTPIVNVINLEGNTSRSESRTWNTVKEKKAKITETKKIKSFNVDQMNSLLNQVKLEKERLNNDSKSIKIIKTNESNISNVFELAQFFKENGYVIAGREIRGDQVDNYKIQVDEIVMLTIGTF